MSRATWALLGAALAITPACTRDPSGTERSATAAPALASRSGLAPVAPDRARVGDREHSATLPNAGSPRSAPEPTHYLGEWFALEHGRCQLVAAERSMTEPGAVPRGRLADDVYVVVAKLGCEAHDGQPSAPSAVLRGAELSWVDDQRGRHEASTRTALSAALAPEQLLFEVPAHRDGLPRTRRYDARSGEPEGARERRHARLTIAQAGRTLTVAPWPRFHDRELDLFLDRLARTLATGAVLDTLSAGPEGHGGIETAAALYAQALARFQPQLLTVSELHAHAGGLRATLSLERATASGQSGPVVSLAFELGSAGRDTSVLRLLEADRARDQLACAEAKGELAERVNQARADRAALPFCNVLGVRLPGPCASAEPALLAEALRVGLRCGSERASDEPPHRKSLPSDFALRVRRSRAPGSFDTSPRYTLAIERSGRVLFSGSEVASGAPPREGRTAPALVERLYGELLQLGFFVRSADSDPRCRGSDARGDLITVRASGRERSVRDRDGCRGDFSEQELAAVREAVERTAALEGWSTPTLGVEDQRTHEVWVVAAE